MNAVLMPKSKPRTHGHCLKGRPSPTYQTWRGMVERTTNFAHKSFESYGALGIDPDFLGKGGFERFLAHVGERPEGHTLDRIKNDVGYFKGNLRWARKLTQEANKTRPKYYGRTSEEWAEKLGVKPTTIRKRRERGMDPAKAFPVHLRKEES